MATVIVLTYFRINGDFVPIDRFEGEIADKDYVEGAIDCYVDGRPILTTHHWDLVDQLWAFIVDGLRTLDDGRDYEGYFPDQPLSLRFESVSPDELNVSVGDESIAVDAMTFRLAIKNGAQEFFTKMMDVNPAASGTWERYHKEAGLIGTPSCDDGWHGVTA